MKKLTPHNMNLPENKTQSTQQPIQRWNNRFYFSRYVVPHWEDRFIVTEQDAPIDPHRCWHYPTKQEVVNYQLTTISTWFPCPYQPLRTNTKYIATDKKTFRSGVVAYMINGYWYNENVFDI